MCIVAVRQPVFARLCEAMGRPELSTDERFRSSGTRGRHRDQVNQIVAAWAARLDALRADGTI